VIIVSVVVAAAVLDVVVVVVVVYVVVHVVVAAVAVEASTACYGNSFLVVEVVVTCSTSANSCSDVQGPVRKADGLKIM
jgi:hypothetical protein